MKLFDKIKDLFMDEVAEDDEFDLEEEENSVYEEPKDVLPKVMRDTIEREEEKKIEFKMPKEEVKEEPKKEEKVENTRKFSFPIDFEDELPKRNNKSSNVNVIDASREATKKVVELYPKKEEVKEKPKFKATPVISPVYGILDKNYKKDEVKEKSEDNFEMKRPSKKVDFETVRKKAFGNLADDIKDNLMCENCELYKEAKKMNALTEDDLLYDMTIDDEDVTINKAYENYEEFGVAYEVKSNPLREKIDEEIEEVVEEEPTIEDDVEDVVLKKVTVDEVEDDEEKIPSREKKKKETKVDEDFFELIDSMYKERVDD